MIEARIDLRRTRVSLFYLIAYLLPLSVGLLVVPSGTLHSLGSNADHATIAWRLFGGLLLALALIVIRLVREHRSAAYINTAIGRMVFVGVFSFLVGKTGNQAYVVILAVLSFGETWTLIALAADWRERIAARRDRRGDQDGQRRRLTVKCSVC